jgi:hypothetical protein
MENFFDLIYGWFGGLFGQELAYLLRGFDYAQHEYNNANSLILIGVITLVVAVFIVSIYYYIFDHPRYNRWWHWFITLLITGGLGLLIGFLETLPYMNEYIGEDLSTGDGVHVSDCWGFGVSNMCVAILFFVFLSLIVVRFIGGFPKLASRNCKYSPF